MKRIKTISDKPILYDRMPDKGYGVPVEGHHFYGTAELKIALESLAVDLLTIGWLPHIEAFLSAGFQVNKGSATNAHRLGIAWDWDGIIMACGPFTEIPWDAVRVYSDRFRRDGGCIHKAGYTIYSLLPKNKTRAACLCSRHFGVVLGDFYDSAHEDHLHCDLSKPVKFRDSESQIGLVQASGNAWCGCDLKVDRVLGPKTMKAMIDAVQGRGSGEGSMEKLWRLFIDMIAMEPPK